jgi:diaminopimelate epimerase
LLKLLIFMTPFWKYQGTGNDFIMIDNRSQAVSLNQEQIERLCHRRFGIGADGFILIENADGFDFKMVYFNSDGKPSSMCGNGGRCTVAFAHKLGIFSDSCTFIAADGPHKASINADWVELEMIDVSQITEFGSDLFLNTGSPHFIREVENLSAFDVKNEGAVIRYSDYWKSRGGTNVNFVDFRGLDHIAVRTYERGVEDETFSCGTGVTAAAIAAHYLNKTSATEIRIKTLGGDLKVSFEPVGKHKYQNVILSGPTCMVYVGEF